MIRIERVIAEALDRVHISKILQVFIVPGLDLLDLVGCAEAVKEVDERNASLERCKVGNRCQVHDFLYGRGAEHRASCLTTCINVRMVAEDGQSVACHSAGGYVEDARKLLARDLVQVRDHQQKSLGSGECRRQSACCEGAVIGTGSTGFGLHLRDLDLLAEDVLAAGCRPFIDMLGHDG